MDKIYTRKRLRIPQIKYSNFRSGKVSIKNKLLSEIVVILIIAITTLVVIIQAMTPIIDKICKDAAKTKATIVSNNMATEVMNKYTYNDLISIYKDNNGNISMLQSNIVNINAITSDVAVKIQNELINSEESMGKIKFRKPYRSQNFFWNRTRYLYKIFRYRNS